MAKIRELTGEWHKWIKTRPLVIQELAKRIPSDRLYLLKTSNHRVEIYGYVEDNTLIVSVLGKWNKVMFERNVFGIKPEDLEECDLPLSDEKVGVMLTQEEGEQYVERLGAIKRGMDKEKEKK